MSYIGKVPTPVPLTSADLPDGGVTTAKLAASLSLTTPALGTPSSGNFSSGTFTWPTFNQNTSGTAAGLSALLSPASGGTGVANNASATVTSSGNYAYTRTLTGATNVTFPTTGTLATLAGAETLTNKTFTGYTETVYTLATSGSVALNPANGTIQSCAAAGAVTFTDSIATGQSIVLRLANGASYTITWPTMTWAGPTGNAAPTLSAGNVVVLWKEDSTLYGAHVGKYA